MSKNNGVKEGRLFHYDLAEKKIIGTRAAFNKANKGVGEAYDQLADLMAKQPTFEFKIIEPKQRSAKRKQSYDGMNIEFMLDYCSAVGQLDFRAKLILVRDFLKKSKKPVYPTIKRMFLEHFAPGKNVRFAYDAAKVIVNNYRYEGIITAATSHTEPVKEVSNNANLSPAAGF